jgi:DNA-binding response OmpR family regulator
MQSSKTIPREKSELIELIHAGISNTGHKEDTEGFRGFLITKWDGNPHRQFDRGASNIIVVEHRPPDINGINITRDVLAVYPKMRFVVVSADEGAEKKAMEAGAVIFLKNPISFIDLHKRIDELSAR